MEVKTSILGSGDRTQVMGILNVTPDSFSDGGRYNQVELAIKRALEMQKEGADIIDIGGESTRPDHDPVSVTEEIERVIPVIEALKEVLSIPISIDTYKAETAEAAIKAGAEIINDIWGAKYDKNIAKVAAKYEVPIILMHNRHHKDYNSLIDDMIKDLEESIHIAKQAGCQDEQIILDPGIGFAKTPEQNYEVMRQLERFTETFPYPLLLGTSRKSFITQVLEVEPEKRDNATGATTCLGITKGVSIVRVHDVKRNVELCKMMDAMVKGLNKDGSN